MMEGTWGGGVNQETHVFADERQKDRVDVGDVGMGENEKTALLFK
jgi:hypothetical protein